MEAEEDYLDRDGKRMMISEVAADNQELLSALRTELSGLK